MSYLHQVEDRNLNEKDEWWWVHGCGRGKVHIATSSTRKTRIRVVGDLLLAGLTCLPRCPYRIDTEL